MQRNLQNMCETIQAWQPISSLGAARHVWMWVTTPLSPSVYINTRSHTGSIKIYCLHGTADMSNAFSLIADRLINQDLPEEISAIQLVRFDHRGQGQDIESFARQLKDQIVTNRDQDVILMGHSRGGLVAAYFAEHLASENNINVHAVISICSPFSGSHLALPPLTIMSRSVNEMQENSQFLNRLTAKMNVSPVSYHYFSAEGDAIVKPASCVINEHRDRLVNISRHGHLSILSSHKLVKQIRLYINQAVSRYQLAHRQISPA